jgi:hypothetical protein
MKRILPAFVLFAVLAVLCLPKPVFAQSDDPSPPGRPVKLIFIHHSTGENWLTDGYGDLGRSLAENNYFVSDTNYGWGPEAIGDRTDIPNWPEWFAGDQTSVYMDALFKESEQHAGYTRTFTDPGGENQVVMFKSCFPNSDLEGSPNDSPDPDGWLSVGHAKYVYNQILPYFASRPDKLFIVITAPPLSSSTHAANARAFNNWLLNNWLAENNYPHHNVAVFDFYNILTSPDAHHHYAGGYIEHTTTSRNTLAYPSGDDHPSTAGSRKATEEFIPLLNIFYNRWVAGGGPGSQPSSASGEPAAAPTAGSARPMARAGEIDAFEAPNALSSDGWQAYHDETADNRITCSPSGDRAHGGSQALQIDYAVAAGSWATCDLRFDSVQDWSATDGLTFFLQSSRVGLPYHVDIFTGTHEQTNGYVYVGETPPDSAGGWSQINLGWGDFHRVEWEENAGSPLEKPASVVGLAFGFSPPEAAQEGTLWIDDLALSSGAVSEAIPSDSAPTAEAGAPPDETARESRGFQLPCASSLALPLAVFGASWAARKRIPRR